MQPTTRIFPTSYFPSIALAAAMVQSGDVPVEVNETFPKQTHRNRTVIMTAAGPETLSVPVVRPDGTHTRTGDIRISYAEKWNLIHWRAIVSAYNASPFFLYYRDDFEKILMRRYDLLTELNEELLAMLFKKIKADCSISHTETFIKPGTEGVDDYRDRYNYKHPYKNINYPTYTQVFSDRMPFNGNVSVLDLLFNLGPETKGYLLNIMFHGC